MKKISKFSLKKLQLGGIAPNIAIMAMFILCGVVAGSVFYTISSENFSSVFSLDNDIKNLTLGGTFQYHFGKSFANLIKYPIIIFLLAFTAFGFLLIPGVVLLKGFSVSYAVASVIYTFGVRGLWLALALFGIQTALSVPCILLISSLAFEISKLIFSFFMRSKNKVQLNTIHVWHFILHFLLFILILLLTAIIDVAITPKLVSIASKNIIN